MIVQVRTKDELLAQLTPDIPWRFSLEAVLFYGILKDLEKWCEQNNYKIEFVSREKSNDTNDFYYLLPRV